jgi:endonuclease/exonuclease/phosphatase family metal-dependent hydrolase
MKRLAGWMLSAALLGCPGRAVVAPVDGGLKDGGPGDSGLDGGTGDAGIDAGDDAGLDAGDDAGVDAGEVDAGPSYRCLPRDGGVPDGGLLRVIAANLSSGNLQSYDPGEGARILKGLNPDVVLIQEWNIGNKTDNARRAWVDATFGPEFCFQVESGAQIPNGVISRYPILDAGNWVDSQVPNRSFVWAQIDVPGDRDLWAVSLHLLSTGGPTARSLEATELVADLNAMIPAADLLVVGGDLNTSSRTEAAITTLGAVVRTAGPHPADGNNNQNTNASRSNPYDWVLADADLALLQVPVTIGDAGYSAGLVFDSRVFSPLSDVPPVLAGDSAAPSMQHMAVVKDFLLP